jgi:MoxR-like ATPase
MDINVDPVTPSRALKIMRATLKASKGLPYNLPFFLHGQPGIGKSDLVEQLAKEFDMNLTVQMLTQIEATDLRGLQFIDTDTKKTVNYPPDWLPGPNDKPTIIFLDELPSAETRLQVAGYQLLLSRRVGQYVLAPQHYICGAGNRIDDGAVVYEMGTALADRLQHINIVPEPKSWLEWASISGIHPGVMTFIQLKGHKLEQLEEILKAGQLVGPSPRSWERVSGILNTLGTHDRDTIEPMIQGWVGKATAHDFFLTIEELADLPDPRNILSMDRKKMKEYVPQKETNLWGLTFSLVAYADDVPKIIKATEFMEEMVEHGPKNVPLGDIQKMGMEMLMDKGLAMHKEMEMLEHETMRKYLEEAEAVIAIGEGK